MEVFFNEYATLIGSVILTILLYLLAPVVVAYAITRFLLKIAVLALVLYYANKIVDFVTLGMINIMPDNALFTGLMCQFGVIDGLNIFLKLMVIVYFYRLTIRVLITS